MKVALKGALEFWVFFACVLTVYAALGGVAAGFVIASEVLAGTWIYGGVLFLLAVVCWD